MIFSKIKYIQLSVVQCTAHNVLVSLGLDGQCNAPGYLQDKKEHSGWRMLFFFYGDLFDLGMGLGATNDKEGGEDEEGQQAEHGGQSYNRATGERVQGNSGG